MGLPEEINKLTCECMDLLEKVKREPEKMDDMFAEFFVERERDFQANQCSTLPKFIVSSWLNSRPLDFESDLRGKVVLLDFFTYCCINCIHLLSVFSSIEKRLTSEDGFAIVGVHSGKFKNENDLNNVKSALERYGVTHPVIFDPAFRIWNALGIQCWPTVVLIGPKRQLLFACTGEEYKEYFQGLVDSCLKFYAERREISYHSLSLSVPTSNQAHNFLFFPGKINVYGENQLIISDSGNNRIVITDSQGSVQYIIGSGTEGHIDGTYSESQFNSPQGVSILPPTSILVADTRNHAIRKIDLLAQKVSTIAENLCSPWDLCLYPEDDPFMVIIAMAGPHQIWAYFLKATTLWKCHYDAGTYKCIAGSGKEENRNNTYALQAGFAQPSGVTYASSLNCVFIADSESSTVRCLNMHNGEVKGIVGGGFNPLDLFTFGDTECEEDGKALLQHPLGVTWHKKEHCLYVADSYNHKVKVVEPIKRSCHDLCGAGNAGDHEGTLSQAMFNEPGGLCMSNTSNILFVADTNNHCIKVVELDKGCVKKLKVVDKLRDGDDKPTASDVVTLQTKGRLTLVFDESHLKYLNADAPNKWNVKLNGELQFLKSLTCNKLENEWQHSCVEGPITKDTSISFDLLAPAGSTSTVTLYLLLYFCVSSEECKVHYFKQQIEVQVKEDAPSHATYMLPIEVPSQ